MTDKINEKISGAKRSLQPSLKQALFLNELSLELTDISPREFFGEHNTNIDLLKKTFPKLKIVARGSRIKVYGDPPLLEEFNRRFEMLTTHFSKYNKLDENAIAHILSSDGKDEIHAPFHSGDVLVHGVSGRLVKAQTANQRRLVEAMEKNDMVFAIGPAGTGKTYTGVALAVRALKNKQVKRIILTRPAVEAGENLGFLPGDLKEKLDPYMQPLYDALRDMIPAEKLVKFLEDGTIQIAPMAFMRGRTLDHAFVILDEAQNTTTEQMKMFLTRIGFGSKAIITGDVTQTDLPTGRISGLNEVLSLLKGVEGIAFCWFTEIDVVRHPIVQEIIKAYERYEKRT